MKEYTFYKKQIGRIVLSTPKAPQLPANLHSLKDLRFKSNFPFNQKRKAKLPIFFTFQSWSFRFYPAPNLNFKAPFSFCISHPEQETLPTEAIQHDLYVANWETRQSTGFIDLDLRDSRNQSIWKLETEIFPVNLDYKSEFQIMLKDMQTEMNHLASLEHKRTFFFLAPSELPILSDFQHKKIWEYWIHRWTQCMDRIKRQPHFSYQRGTRMLPPRLIRKPIYSRIRTYPEKLLPAVSREKTFHTSPNLLIVQLHKRLIDQSKGLPYHQFFEDSLKDYQRIVQITQKQITDSEIHPAHLPESYREAYQIYQLLHRAFSLSTLPLARASFRELHELYEYWAFLKLSRIIEEESNGKIDFQNAIEAKDDKWNYRLRQGSQVLIHYEDQNGESEIRLWYNRRFEGAAMDHRPDFLIELRKKGEREPFCLFLDAKYRYQSSNGKIQVAPGSLSQMHRYRDAILEQFQISSGQKSAQKALGAIILFPYPYGQDQFQKSDLYNALQENMIGALPLKAGDMENHSLLRKYIHNFLHQPSEGHFESIIQYKTESHQETIRQFSKNVIWIDIQKLPEWIHYLEMEEFPYHDQAFEKDTAAIALMDTLEEVGLGLLSIERMIISSDREQPFIKVKTVHLQKFDLPIELPRHWQRTNLGALEKAIQLSSPGLIYAPHYKGFRIWQELFPHSENLTWESSGFRFEINGQHNRIMFTHPQQIRWQFCHQPETILNENLSVKDLVDMIHSQNNEF